MAVKRKKEPVPDLDLVPIMNLVTILIPFLIMAAEFIQLAVIDSSAPPIGKPPPSDMTDEDPFQLIVMIMDNGLYIDGSKNVKQYVYGEEAESSGGDDDKAREPKFRCVDSYGSELDRCESKDHYNWQALADLLVELKSEFSDETLQEDIFIMPEHEIRYEVIVRAMDVVRNGSGLVDLDPEWKKVVEDTMTANEAERAKRAPPVLFPKVVIGGGKLED
jgi:biopolymer transport protein ExbD